MKLKMSKGFLMKKGLQVAGGVGANQAMNILQQQASLANFSAYIPALVAGVGVGGEMMFPKAADFFDGMSTIALTEIAEKMLGSVLTSATPVATTTVTQGVNSKQFRMGSGNTMYGKNTPTIRNGKVMQFSPQYMVKGQASTAVKNGVPFR